MRGEGRKTEPRRGQAWGEPEPSKEALKVLGGRSWKAAEFSFEKRETEKTTTTTKPKKHLV